MWGEISPVFYLLGACRKKLLLKGEQGDWRLLPTAFVAALCIRFSQSPFLSLWLHWKTSANRFLSASPNPLLPAAPPTQSLF